MDSALLKFVIVAALAFAVIYGMRSPERYQPFDESATNRFERNAAYTPSGAAAPAQKRVWKPKPKVAAKSPLLQASTQAGRPTNVGIAANLLPKPQPGGPGAFGQFAPNPEALAGKNFVDASRWVSLGSMTSRRNINRDIRSDIPIPKTNAISPWNQSSIDQQIVGRSLDC